MNPIRFRSCARESSPLSLGFTETCRRHAKKLSNVKPMTFTEIVEGSPITD